MQKSYHSAAEDSRIRLPDLFQLIDVLAAVLSPSQVMPATVVTLKWASAQGWLRDDQVTNACYGLDRASGPDITVYSTFLRSSPAPSRADEAGAAHPADPAAEATTPAFAPADEAFPSASSDPASMPPATPNEPAPMQAPEPVANLTVKDSDGKPLAQLAPDECAIVAEPEAPAPAKPEPWSDEELITLQRMKSDGRTAAEISKVLTGRTIPAIYTRLKMLRDAPVAEKPAPTLVPIRHVVVAPVSATATVPPVPDRCPKPPVAERRTVPVSSKGFGALPMRPGPAAAGFSEIEAVLNALGYAEPWNATMDLELAERLARGEQLAVIADDLGVELGKAKARFVAMTPDGVTIEGQARLLKVLRARAEGAA